MTSAERGLALLVALEQVAVESEGDAPGADYRYDQRRAATLGQRVQGVTPREL